MTRELFVGLTTNLESCIQRYEDDVAEGRQEKDFCHPRSFSTDDIESFFSVLRGILGSPFTLKTIYEQLRSVILWLFH